MERNYGLIEEIKKMEDDVLVDVDEVAAFTNFASVTIQQRKIQGFPLPLPGLRRLRWRLGDIRAWGRSRSDEVRAPAKRKTTVGNV